MHPDQPLTLKYEYATSTLHINRVGAQEVFVRCLTPEDDFIIASYDINDNVTGLTVLGVDAVSTELWAMFEAELPPDMYAAVKDWITN